jgi:hypothetical protein
MFRSTRSGRLFAAMALAALFFLAIPAEAAEGRGGPPGLFDRLIAWVTDGWDGWLSAVSYSSKGSTSTDQEGGYLDPNGGGGRTGSCTDPAACENPLPAGSGSGS